MFFWKKKKKIKWKENSTTAIFVRLKKNVLVYATLFFLTFFWGDPIVYKCPMTLWTFGQDLTCAGFTTVRWSASRWLYLTGAYLICEPGNIYNCFLFYRLVYSRIFSWCDTEWKTTLIFPGFPGHVGGQYLCRRRPGAPSWCSPRFWTQAGTETGTSRSPPPGPRRRQPPAQSAAWLQPHQSSIRSSENTCLNRQRGKSLQLSINWTFVFGLKKEFTGKSVRSLNYSFPFMPSVSVGLFSDTDLKTEGGLYEGTDLNEKQVQAPAPKLETVGLLCPHTVRSIRHNATLKNNLNWKQPEWTQMSNLTHLI